MKVFEIFSQNLDKPGIDFDLHDDIVFFMKNDPEFYRKEFYPLEIKITRMHRTDRDTSPSMLKSLVNSAYKQYRNKFQISELDNDISIDDLKEICEKLHSDILQHIRDEQTKKEK